MAVLPGFPLLSDSDDDDNVVELPNGQLVCCRHARIVCHKCFVDFSFMVEHCANRHDDDDNDDDDDDDDDEEEGDNHDDELPDLESMVGDDNNVPKPDANHPTEEELDELMGLANRKRGTGRVLPSRFVPPNTTITPLDLFRGVNTSYHFARYVHRQDKTKGLIFTDGACLNNGQPNPRAGWGFVAGPPELAATYSCGIAKGRLENQGPFNDEGLQTSNRAELRAVLAALGLRYWPGEGFKTLVFATDSEYVVEGATKWIKGWLKNGWTTAKGAPVKNKDLWEMLLGEVERFSDAGLKIEFWRVPREWNTEADKLAKEGAAIEDIPKHYAQIIGF